ncbi:30S ribosomal protein S18 [Candidatus Woesebacteria bacterium]|nr:30S ribosomal protein S18 [Candidatus Woesebacteria bacterium]
MARKKTRRRRKKIEPENEFCPFCLDNDKVPDYKEYKKLEKILTDRARIVSSERSGVCTKHQRKLTTHIKRARHLGLLPFAPKV